MHGKTEALFNPYQAHSKYDGSVIYLPVHLKASHHITAGNTNLRAALQTGEQDSRSLVTLQCLVSCAAIKMSC